jgi:glycosyltransferase involved in cell wall biosynthesis
VPNKRVAILGTRGIPARYGGFETFAEELGVRLVERGIEVTVFCEKVIGGSQAAKYRGIDLEYVQAHRLGPFTTIIFDLTILWRARKRFDVVYMLGYGASLFCFIPRMHGAEVWINMDGVEWLRSKWSWPARAYLRAMETIAMWTPDRIIADAVAIQSHLRSRHRHLPECTVIPYGAEVVTSAPSEELLAEWKVKPGEYFTVVCRLEPENHVLEILEGYAASSSHYALLVLGDYKLNTLYVRQLQSITDPRVRLIGTVYDKARLSALRFHARGYFHGHSVGGTNPSLLEAMATGNAVIAHDNVFNREVAADAAVYFRESKDIPAILEILEADTGRLQRMRAIARQRVESIYNWQAVTDRYETLLGSQ